MKLELRRLLEGEAILVMMTSKQDWTAFGDDYDSSLLYAIDDGGDNATCCFEP